MKEIYEMKGSGYSIRDIARELDIARNTVRRYLKDPEAVMPKRRRRSSKLDPYIEYMDRRLSEGLENCVVLWREHEQEHFVQLLRGLCDTIEQPPRPKGAGRPRLPLSDTVFGSALKVYSTMSTRRAMTDMRNAQAAGLLEKAPSTASTWRCMENPDLTPVLEHLIQISALPLRAVEHDFAADSTAFATSIYHRYFDHKWNKLIEEAIWVKAHAMCEVKTNIITAAEATAGESADATRFTPFVETTAQHFTINEVSADKAYLSKKNLRAVEAVGGAAYIPFKSNSTPTQGHHKRDALWERAYHYYHLNRAEFLQHYHKRSNVETTFAMVKAKFGPAVRSKMPSAQVNEVLLKFLCHKSLSHEVGERSKPSQLA